MYTFSPRGKAFTEKEEGTVYYVYDDAVAPTRMWKRGEPVHGHLTAGVGHLLSPREIGQFSGNQIAQSVVDLWFDRDNDAAERTVSDLVKVQLPENRAQVLLDFTFNNGPAAFRSSSLLKRVNAEQFDRVPQELLKWTHTHINGKLVTSSGLQKRASDRIALWNSGDVPLPLPPPIDAPTGTPMAVPAPAPTSPFEWASIGVSGLGGLAGFSGVGGFFGISLGIVLIGAFLLGAAYVIKRRFFTT